MELTHPRYGSLAFIWGQADTRALSDGAMRRGGLQLPMLTSAVA